MPHLTNPSFETRLRRYALSAASVTAASAATGVAVAGGVPPTMAVSGAGWSWSNTLLNNATGAAGGGLSAYGIWGNSLLSNNLVIGMRRFNNGIAGGTFRDIDLSQRGWSTGVHFAYWGRRGVAGQLVDAVNTGGGNAVWTAGFRTLVSSTRAGGVTNTAAAWGVRPGRSPLMGASGREFVTFKIVDFGDTYYGWLDLETQEDASKNLTLTIHGWAYSTGSILVGAAPVAIPGGAGLAALVFGAAGLRGRRRVA